MTVADITPLHRGEPDEVRLSDVGNSHRLLAAHGADLHFVPQWGEWLVWDGRRWQRDTKGVVTEKAKQVVAGMFQEVAHPPPSLSADERKALSKWALASESAQRIGAMIQLARSVPGIPVEPHELDANPYLLNVGNGTVDLRTGEKRAHDREDLMTKMAGTTYRPTARAERFKRFLESILPDAAVRRFLQRFFGYCLTGAVSEQVLVVAYGGGSNGKSTLARAIQEVMGEYAMEADTDLLLARRDTHPTGVADLLGARFVVAQEVDEGRRLNEAQVKQLTGGDRIKARRMRQDFFEFDPTHKLMLATNHRPDVRGTDYAIWRRLKLVPFEVTITGDQQDRSLPDVLRNEAPGILQWMIAGCVDWHHAGLTDPHAVRIATDDYRAAMDVLGAFIAERCVTGPTTKVASKALYADYLDWCHRTGEQPMSQRRLGQSLGDRGYQQQRTMSERQWHGIGLVDGAEHDA